MAEGEDLPEEGLLEQKQGDQGHVLVGRFVILVLPFPFLLFVFFKYVALLALGPFLVICLNLIFRVT